MDYLFTFLEGIASFISPCILPMLPIYVSYFIGQNEKNNKKTVINAIGFVLGFTIIFKNIIWNYSYNTWNKLYGNNKNKIHK